jgi:hypothetical protein
MPWYDFLDEDEYGRWSARKFRERTAPKPRPVQDRAYQQAMGKIHKVERKLEPAVAAQRKENQYVNDVIQKYNRGEIDEETANDLLRGTATKPGGIHGILGKYGPELGPGPAGLSAKQQFLRGITPFITPATEYLPPPVRPGQYIRKLPGGEVAAPMIEGLTSPAGLAAVAAFPVGVTARMTGYGIAGGVAGQLAERVGVPIAQVGPIRIGPRAVGEAIGTVAGPTVGPGLERLAGRAVRQVSPATREFLERTVPAARRLATGERGEIGPLGRVPEEVPRVTPPEAPVTPGETPVEKFRRLTAEGQGEEPLFAGLPEMEPPVGFRPPPAAGVRTSREIMQDIADLGEAAATATGRKRLGQLADELATATARQKITSPQPPPRYDEVYQAAMARMEEAPSPMTEIPISPAAGEGAGAAPPAGARPPSAGGFAEYEAAGAEEGIVTRWRETLTSNAGKADQPPTPPRPPTAKRTMPPEAEPPESVGHRFAAPLREFDDVVGEVVTTDNPVVKAVVANTGINPSVAANTPTGKILTAYWRQRVAAEELTQVATSTALDVHAQPFTGLRATFRINVQGEVGNVEVRAGQSRIWQDVFSRPDDYTLTVAQRTYIDDFHAVIDEVEALRVQAGLKPRAKLSQEGWLYTPRQVKGIRGVELRRPSSPGLQRIYEEAQEGVAKGIRYDADPRATLELHVRNAYRDIIERQLSDALEPLSLGPKEFVPPVIRSRMETAVKARLGAERQLRRMNADYLKRASKGKAGWPAREARLAEMRSGLETQQATVATAKQEYLTAKNAYSRAMEAARKAEVAPGNLFGQAEETIPIGQWRSRFFPREDADLLKEKLGSFLSPAQRTSPLARGVEILGNYIRFLASVGDFAEPFIQGLPTLFYRPWVWARAAARHYQAFLDPTVQARFMRDHIETFQKMAQSGTPIGDPEFFAALTREGGMSPGRLLKMLPKGEEAREVLRFGGKQTFGRFQATYNTGLGANRALLYESLQPTWKGTESELWAHIRNMTGGLDSRALGVGPSQRALESVWGAFSPRLLRSTAALISDLRQGPTTARGLAAWKALGGLCAGATGVYVLTGLGLGKSWEEISVGLNPTAGKKFLAHEINGDWIGVGGQVRAIVQLLGKSAAHPGQLTSPDLVDNPLLGFYSSRGAPAMNIVGGLVEATTGANVLPYDYIDSLPDLAKHLGTSALPFALQGRLEGEQWTTTGFSLVGLRTQARTSYDRLDALSLQTTGKPYKDLDTVERKEFLALPEAKAIDAERLAKAVEQGQGWAEQREFRGKGQAEAEKKLSDILVNPQATMTDFTNTFEEWRAQKASQNEALYRDTPESDPRSDMEKYADEFWTVELTNPGGLPDWDTFFAEREAVLKAHPGLDAWLKRNEVANWTNTTVKQAVGRVLQAYDVRREYYAIPSKRGITLAEEDELRPYTRQISAYMKQGMSRMRAVREVTDSHDLRMRLLRYLKRRPNPERKTFREAHPELQWFEALPIDEEMWTEEEEPQLVGAR